MQTLKKFYFGKQKMKPNFFIGGVASQLPTPASLSAIFSFNQNFYVKGFKIVGSDVYVELFCTTNFTMINNATIFKDNPLITYIKETTGKLVGTNVSSNFLFNCANLAEVYLVGFTTTHTSCMSNCNSLDVNKVYLPNLTNPGYALLSNTALYGSGKTLNLPKVNAILNNDNTSFNNFNGTINLLSLTTIPNYFLNKIFGTINIQNCISLGSPSVNNNVFLGCDSRTTINIHNSMATINAGAPDADLVYAIGRGATVNYI
jgi:hypothetical protein